MATDAEGLDLNQKRGALDAVHEASGGVERSLDLYGKREYLMRALRHHLTRFYALKSHPGLRCVALKLTQDCRELIAAGETYEELIQLLPEPPVLGCKSLASSRSPSRLGALALECSPLRSQFEGAPEAWYDFEHRDEHSYSKCEESHAAPFSERWTVQSGQLRSSDRSTWLR